MNAYMIPGMAADKRVFRHIELPEEYHVHYLEWIKPEKDETLNHYALRLANQIDRQAPFILIGLSFGGMLAAEIAKQYRPQKLILIASIPQPEHLPTYFRKGYNIGLHKLLAPTLIRNLVYVKRFFTSESPEDKAIIKQMAREMDQDFIRWAIDAIMTWTSDTPCPECFHIHGTHDEILPLRYTKPTVSVPRAGHLMIFNKAGEINNILKAYLVKRNVDNVGNVGNVVNENVGECGTLPS